MNPSRSKIKATPARRAAHRALARSQRSAPDENAFGSLPEFDALSPRERSLARRLWRGTLQNRRLIDVLLDRSGFFRVERTPPPTMIALRLAVYQKVFLTSVPDHAIGEQTVELCREGGGESSARFANAVVRRLLAWLPSEPESLDPWLSATIGPVEPAVRWSVPDAVATALASGYGASALDGILRAFNEEETSVWVRVNSARTTGPELRDRASREGVELEPSALAPDLLRWKPGSKPPWESGAWAEGAMTVQDLGARVAAHLLAPASGDRVIDWCAAPGGKTGHLHELAAGRAQITALEIDERRRETLRESMQRLYGSDHGIRIIGDPGEAGQADALLVDAPCLGLGLLRRHPEARWDGRIEGIAAMVERQARILCKAAGHVAPGGRLLWVTCSPTREENEELIEAFLRENESFASIDLTPRIPDWAKPWTTVRGAIARTRPDRAPVDAFAMAMLRRSDRAR